ncbi:hypothetical protein SOV_22900 [Sporomusa ovata DSM 2662]|uniref:Uncharacterized protein n=1 Tax=Sporomusa ovata TaxID=2378 RepID=A0A0U1L5I2_9FIRM|nr:hypothetical protein [Sporomusa ovata]EQB25606.1 hypothetical protein SOV_4c02690 [Sporomusa ovata DSM 2662]CQR74164.1 hypothetical protein SpAn4DRAFT_0626 [Sporomusa ovata]
MTAKELSILIRVGIDDLQVIKISDYEMLVLINLAIRQVNNSLCEMNSDLVEKDAVLPVNNDGYAELPANFQRPIAVVANSNILKPYSAGRRLDEFGYRITDGKLYVIGKEAALYYNHSFAKLMNMEEVLPVPDTFVDYLVDVVCNKIDGRPINNDIANLVQRRKYSHMQRKMPFCV